METAACRARAFHLPALLTASALSSVVLPPPARAENLVFTPLAPCRVIDTRQTGAGGPLVPNVTRNFFLRGPARNYQTTPAQGGKSSGCGIPDLSADGGLEGNLARAVALNIVAVNPAGPGHLTAWPTNQQPPEASVINYGTAGALANGIALPLCDTESFNPCTSGDLSFQAAVSSVHLVVDVVGYYHHGTTVHAASNTALGQDALATVTTATHTVALGAGALHSLTTGERNTAIGSGALAGMTSGGRNVAVGQGALAVSTIGAGNTATGASALFDNTIGHQNTAVGFTALGNNTTGIRNTAVGVGALGEAVEDDRNVAVGAFALNNLTSGSENLALGSFAGTNVLSGSTNVLIAHAGSGAESATIRIGTDGVHTRAFVAGIRNANVSGAPVLVDGSGQLGIASSSLQTKQDVESLAGDARRVLALRPVSFRYREHVAEGDPTLHYGLIAEEVAAVLPELVVFDAAGRPQTVKYHLLAPLLLAELQRAHEDIAQLRAGLVRAEQTIAAQQRAAEALDATLAGLESRLQRLAGDDGTTTLTTTAGARGDRREAAPPPAVTGGDH